MAQVTDIVHLSRTNAFNVFVRRELLGKASLGESMTFAVKANIGCGFPASASTPSLRDWVPENVSSVVRCLVDRGHLIVAIANMHELAFGITSENPAFGDIDNPRKPGYIPGGSSGGSAAAVAMNAVSFSLGTDTGGSMRIPAALCGVVGYRPTTGLYDSRVVCPLSSTTDTIGIFAHLVNTVQKVHKMIVPSYSPVTRSLHGVRIGVPRQYYYSVLDHEVSQVTEAALQSLSEAGVELVEADFPPEFGQGFLDGLFDLITYETYRLIPKFLKDEHAPVSFEELTNLVGDPIVKHIIESADRVSETRYNECQQLVGKISRLFDNYFKINSLDAFMCPTTILPALKRPSPKNVQVCGQQFSTIYAYTHNTFPQAGAGVPCISIPSGMSSDGLPIGLEVVAPRGMDSSLLDLAAAIQAILPPMPQLSFDTFKDRL